MKKFIWIVPLVFLAAGGCAACLMASEPGGNVETGAGYGVGVPQAYGADLDIGFCYDYLSPFGSWINLDPWGYVWCPNEMAYGWRPYDEGYWLWTDFGWNWISDFEWGWIPFHYGRWGWDDGLGWFWVPGTVWGPAWVTWRWSDLYCGWAPIPPGIEFRAGMDFAALGMRIPGRFWIFVGGSHFLDRDIHRYVLPYERNATIINHTTLSDRFSFRGDRFVNDGVSVDVIRRITGRQVPSYRLQDVNRPGLPRVSGGEVRMYRPAFRADTSARPKTYLSQEQARREFGAGSELGSIRKQPESTAEAALRARQAEEMKRLEQSQSRELKSIEQRRKNDQSRVQSSSERARIAQEYQARQADIAKQHQAERRQIQDRHQREVEQVRQAPRKKK
jgi:hypothetical protein